MSQTYQQETVLVDTTTGARHAHTDANDDKPVLEVRHLKVQFPLHGDIVRKAVNDVSFTVRRGSVTCLVGESGSGKSITALSLLNLVPAPGTIVSGEVLFEGRNVLDLDDKELRALRGGDIAVIFQEPMHSLDPVIPIGKQLTEVIRSHEQVSVKEASKQALQWITRVGLPRPESILTSYPHELSGGMLQRVMIAMALSCHPKLLIADEPTTALDVTIQSRILDLLLDLKDEYGLSVLFITHDFGVVAQVADDVAVMYAGKLLEQAPVRELFSHPKHPYTAGLLKTRPVIGSKARRLYSLHDQFPAPEDLTDGTWEHDDWQQIMDDYRARHAAQAARRDVLIVSESARHNQSASVQSHGSLDARAAADNAPLLQVKHLERYFTSSSGLFGRHRNVVKGVDDVSLTINAGETVGLVGESGSGKTTFGQTILRLQGKTSGEVKFKGRDLFSIPNRELRPIRSQLQYIFQDPYSSLNPRLTIGQSIGNPLLEHGLATRANVRERVSNVLRLCGLDGDILDRYPYQFSGGQRQRIVIARAMALKPDFVVADEPVASLDVSIQAQIINLFSDLKESEHTAFLFISHDLSVVEHLCDRIVIMYLGTVVETGSREELFNHPIHPYTQELLAAMPVADPTQRRPRRGRAEETDLYARRPYAKAIREGHRPPLEQVNADHWVRRVQ